MPRQITEIRLDEHGDETHESWLLVSANTVSSIGTPLFDSEVLHSRFVTVTVTRCSRKRDLNRDWLHREEVLLEWSMSMAQWGAFVSSFGDGSGVPATLTFLGSSGPHGMIPGAPFESRLRESHAEVRNAGERAAEAVSAAFEAYKAHKTVGNLRSLEAAIRNMPSNMEFAARSLTEHTENVVTKARADIEAMVRDAVERGELADSVLPPLLESGS